MGLEIRIGDWRLEIGSWMLDVGCLKFEIWSLKLYEAPIFTKTAFVDLQTLSIASNKNLTNDSFSQSTMGPLGM